MRHVIQRIFSDPATRLRPRIVALIVLQLLANALAWAWALIAFRHFPLLLGTALLAWSFGLRHAVDADHIAAIDNVTRKLMQEGKRPLTVGTFFSLGHSTIVILASVGVAATATAFSADFDRLGSVGGIIGTIVSACFLLGIAAMNLVILTGIYTSFRKVKAGGRYEDQDLNVLLERRGFMARIFRRAFGLVTTSWHMYPLGFLFGLGFDTATEIGLLGISAAEASKGMPIWSILVFPALFAAGMSLVDTLDGILMLGAYGWAFMKPIRKLYYNMTITAVSVIVAIVIGGIEALGLIGDEMKLQGGFWDLIGRLNDNFGLLGYMIIGIFIMSWGLSILIYRLRGYDSLEVGLPLD